MTPRYTVTWQARHADGNIYGHQKPDLTKAEADRLVNSLLRDADVNKNSIKSEKQEVTK